MLFESDCKIVYYTILRDKTRFDTPKKDEFVCFYYDFTVKISIDLRFYR